MVTTSRAKSISNFCFANPVSDLNKNYLMSIGRGPANAQCRNFQNQVIDQYGDIDKPHTMKEIGELDKHGLGSYDRGCSFLLQWYREQIRGWDPVYATGDAASC